MTSLIANLWNRLCSKQTPVTIMIIGLDNSGKTSILNSLHALTTASSNQQQSSSTSSPAPVSKPRDIQQQKQKQQGQQNPLPENRVAKGPSSGQLPQSAVKDSSLGEEDLLLSEADEIGGQESGSSGPVSGDQLCKLSGSNLRRRSCDNYSPTVGYNFERLQYKGHTMNVLDISGQSKYRGLWQEFYNCVDAIVFVIDSSDTIRLVVVRDELENALNHPYFSTLQQFEQQQSNNISSEIKNNNNNNVSSAMGARHPSQVFDLVQKQLTISEGRLIQSPLDRGSFKQAANQQLSSTAMQARQRQSGATQATGSNRKPAAAGQWQRTRVPILFLANKTDLTNSVDTEVMMKSLNLSHLAKSRHPWHIEATSVKTSQGIVEGFDWLVGQLEMAKL